MEPPVITLTAFDTAPMAGGMSRGQTETKTKCENCLERLRQAGVQIPEDIPLEPPQDSEKPKGELPATGHQQEEK